MSKGKQLEFERWMSLVSEQLRTAKNQVKALQARVGVLEGRDDFGNQPKRGTRGTTPGGPCSQTLDMGIYKITADAGNGTYTAHRAYAHSAAGWTDMSTAGIDTTNYTLVSVFEKQFKYVGMLGVGDYVLARYDGMNGTSPIYHIYNRQFSPSPSANPKILAAGTGTAANTDSWDINTDATDYDGVQFQDNRTVYDTTAHILYYFYRVKTHDINGMLIAVSAETRVNVNSAVAC